MLKFLKFRSLVKSSSGLREALAVAADVLGHDAASVRDPQAFRIPSEAALRKGLAKVDLGLMMWSRHCWSHGYKAATCLLADSPEQNHFNFFCLRADSLELPLASKDKDRVQLPVIRHFRRSILPVSVLGYGETDLAHKVKAMIHTAKLMTGSSSAMEAWRNSVRGMCTD